MDDRSVETSLDASIKDATAYSVMVGLGELYVSAAAVYLKASDAAVALLQTLPLFLGACMQLVTPPMIDRLRRRWPLALGGATVQALTWAPMIVALFLPPQIGVIVVIASNILYFAAIHFTIPAWMSVMGDLVPAEARGRYFGRRNALAITMQLFAGILGGAALDVFKRAGHEGLGFAVIFAGALFARLLSTWYLSRMTEPAYTPAVDRGPSLLEFVRGLRTSNFARFVVFVAAINASAHVAGSITNIYFLRVLHYSYWQYTLVLNILVLASIPALPAWGRLADRFGNRIVLATTAMLIVSAPVLWFVSGHVAWSCVVQAIAGIGWAGFNLCVGNFLFDALPPAHRARNTAYLNVFTNVGVLVGGFAAAGIAWLNPLALGPLRLTHWVYAAFIVSFLLRIAAITIILPRFREVRNVPPVGVVRMLFHAGREVAEAAVNVVTGLVGRK